MDNTLWVVISAAVMLALAGFVLFVGSDGIEGVNDDAEDTQDEAICGFQQNEVDSGRAECGVDIQEDDRCYDQVCD